MRVRIATFVIGGAALVGLATGIVFRFPHSPRLETRQVGSLVLVVDAHAQAAGDIDQATAVRRALQTISTQAQANGAPVVRGYTLTYGYHAAGLTKAATASGDVFSTYSQPRDVWVLQFSAPAQGGWANVTAVAVIDAQDGKLIQFGENKTN